MLRGHDPRPAAAGSTISADLGEQVFAAVLQKPFSWHLQHNTSNVLGYLTKDVEQVQRQYPGAASGGGELGNCCSERFADRPGTGRCW